MAWAIAGGALSGLGQGISTWASQNWQEKMMQELMQGNFNNNLALQNNYFANSQKLQSNAQDFQKQFYTYKQQMAALNTPSQIFGSAMKNSGSLTTSTTNISSPFTPRNIAGVTFNSAGQTPNPTISDDGSPRITRGIVTASKGTGPPPETSSTQADESTAPISFGEEHGREPTEQNMALDNNAAINVNVKKPGISKLIEKDNWSQPNVPATGFYLSNNVD